MKQILIETQQTLASLQKYWQTPSTWLPQWQEIWAAEHAIIIETPEALVRITSRHTGLKATLLRGSDPGLYILAANVEQIS